MAEATWGEAGAIEWTMSASLEDVVRGGESLPEVTSLERAVRAWQAMPGTQQQEAVLTTERPVTLPGETPVDRFVGQAIARLAEVLPPANDEPAAGPADDSAA